MTLILLLFCCLYLGLEILYRKLNFAQVYTRKIAHVCTALGAVLTSRFLTQNEFILLTCLFASIFIISFHKKLLRSIHFQNTASIGEILYPIALLLLAIFLYHERAQFVIGVLLLGIPDTMAWLGGTLRKSQKKTLLGSSLYFLTTLLILSFHNGIYPAIIASIVFTVIERVSYRGVDNITVPIAYLMFIKLA